MARRTTMLLTCAMGAALGGCAGQRDPVASMRVRGIAERLTARADAASIEADPALRRARLSRLYASWSELPALISELYLAEREDGPAAEVEALSRRVNEAIENPPTRGLPTPAWALARGTVPVGERLRESTVAANYRWRIRTLLPACFEN